jgi:hypothetical protein
VSTVSISRGFPSLFQVTPAICSSDEFRGILSSLIACAFCIHPLEPSTSTSTSSYLISLRYHYPQHPLSETCITPAVSSSPSLSPFLLSLRRRRGPTSFRYVECMSAALLLLFCTCRSDGMILIRVELQTMIEAASPWIGCLPSNHTMDGFLRGGTVLSHSLSHTRRNTIFVLSLRLLLF